MYGAVGGSVSQLSQSVPGGCAAATGKGGTGFVSSSGLYALLKKSRNRQRRWAACFITWESRTHKSITWAGFGFAIWLGNKSKGHGIDRSTAQAATTDVVVVRLACLLFVWGGGARRFTSDKYNPRPLLLLLRIHLAALSPTHAAASFLYYMLSHRLDL